MALRLHATSNAIIETKPVVDADFTSAISVQHSPSQVHIGVKMEVSSDQVSDNKAKSSDNDAKKRTRCTNFSSQERNILIHIIEKYQEVIECKKTDKISVQQRDNLWEGVAQEFNDIFLNESVRTPRQLKMCYENLKKRIRKEMNTNDDSQNNSKSGISLLRTQILDSSDEGDSNSSRLNDASNSFQGSIHGGATAQFQTEVYPVVMYEEDHTQTLPIDDEPPRKGASVAKLRRLLLNKQIRAIELDVEMKTKKHEMEIKVEQAKLEYYRKKCAMLDRQKVAVHNGDS